MALCGGYTVAALKCPVSDICVSLLRPWYAISTHVPKSGSAWQLQNAVGQDKMAPAVFQLVLVHESGQPRSGASV